MKKIVLFLTMLLSSAVMFAAQDGKSAETAFDFKWEDDNYVEATSTDVWFKVDLSTKNVASDENVLLYLNNLTGEAATVVVTAYSVTDGGSKLKLQGPETKQILANRNYAIELSHSLFKNLDAVYIAMQTTKRLNFKASAVEPGENDLDCLNAPQFNEAGQTFAAGEGKWYMVDMSDVMATNDQTKEVIVENIGSATATVTVGVSFDCPSTGVTSKTQTIAAKENKKIKINRSYFQMLPADGKVYVKVTTNQPLRVSAKNLTVEADQTITAPDDAIEVELDKTTLKTAVYTVNAENKWFKVKVADWIVKGQLPEVTLENKSTVKASLKGKMLYTKTGVPVERSLSLAAGDIMIKEVAKNVLETAEQNVTDGYVYVYVETAQSVQFSARLKSRTEGLDCGKAKEFDPFVAGAKMQQGAGTSEWYAIVLKTAQQTTPAKDIMLYVENLQDKAASVIAEVSAEGNCVASNSRKATLSAKEKKQRRVLYSLYQGMGDTIWVKVTTDRNIEFSAELVDPEPWEEDKPCGEDKVKETISFVNADSWTGTLVANDTVWYKVDLWSIRDKNKVPTIKLENNTAVAAKVLAGYSLDCPANTQYELRTFTAPYEKAATSDIMNKLSDMQQFAYVRVSATAPITITVSLAFEDEGEVCGKAKLFDWVNCENLDADTAVWYAVALNDIKDPAGDGSQPAQGIRLHLTNRENKVSKIVAEISYECPVKNLTKYTYKLSANASDVTKEISSALLPTEDTVYVRLKSETAIRFCAEGFDEPRINICDRNWEEFNWKDTLNIVAKADSQWVKIPLDTLRGEFVPEVVVLNGATAQKIKALVAFECANAAFQARTKNMTANQKLTKKLEKDMTDAYVNKSDTAYVCIIAQSDAKLFINLVNPNDGSECLKAKDFDEKGQVQEADATVWYKVDIKSIKEDPNAYLRLYIKNLDGFAGNVSARVYFDCPDNNGEAVFERTQKLGKNLTRDVVVLREELMGLNADYVLVELYTAQQDSIWAVREYKPLDFDDLSGCEQSKPLQLNIDITQEANTPTWYEIDLDFLKQHTYSEATLTVYNPSVDTKIDAYLTYECPIVEQPSHRSRTFKAGSGDFVRSVGQEFIQHQKDGKAWVKLVSEQEFIFRVSIVDSMGYACDKNPIEFNWVANYDLNGELVNGNDHPADTALWYIVRLDTLYANGEDKGHDIRVHIDNISKIDINATAQITADCGTAAWQSSTYTIAAGQGKEKEISRAAIEAQGAGKQPDNSINPLYIKLATSAANAGELHGNVHLWAEIIPLEILKDTVFINDMLCAVSENMTWSPKQIFVDRAAEFKDSVLWSASKLRDTTVTVENRLNFVYMDSVRGFFENTQEIDSIFVFNVTRKTLPDAIPFVTKDSIPVVIGGQAMDFDLATKWLEKMYEAAKLDTIIGINNIKWAWHLEGTNAYKDYNNEVVPDVEDSVYLRYKYLLDDCVNSTDDYYDGDDIKLPVLHPNRDTTATRSYICEGAAYDNSNLPNRKGEVITQEPTILYDTVWVAGGTDVIQTLLVDTVYFFKKLTAADLLDPIVNVPVATAGEVLDFSAAEAEILAAYTPAVDQPQLDTVIWMIQELNEYNEHTADYTVPFDKTQLTMYYVAITACGDSIEQANDYTIDVVHNYVNESSKTFMCLGSEYSLREGTEFEHKGILNQDTLVFNDTIVEASAAGVMQEVAHADTLIAYTEWTVPAYSALSDTVVAKVDSPIDVTAADASLQTLINAAAAADATLKPLDMTNGPTAWQIKNADGSYSEIPATALTNENPTITVRYAVVTECDSVWSADVTIDVDGLKERETFVGDSIKETVCVGTAYISRTQKVVITKDTIWQEVVALDDQDIYGDSIYNYHIGVYSAQTLPESVSAQPIAICGHEIDTKDVTAEIEKAFDANESNGAEAVESVVWEVLNGESWTALSASYKIPANASELTLRYVATTACGNTLIDTVDVVVEQPTPENVAELGQFPAASLYGGKLLVVNYKEMKEKYAGYLVGDTLKPEDIHWYKVNGTADTQFVDGIPNGPDAKDEAALDASGNPATGYYYTINVEQDGILAAQTLTGQYYAVINLATSEEEPCGAVARTTVLTTNTTANVIGLAPSYVRQGESLSIYGLDPQTTYRVSIYNTMGTLVEEFRIEGENIHTMVVKEDQGYFMMNVQSENDHTGLKFIVK